MAAPFIVIRTFRIKEGQLEAFRQFLPKFFNAIEAKEPRLLALNAYLNEDGSEASFVHVHPDAASMELHEHVAHEHIDEVRRQFLDATTGLDVYGRPSDAVLQKTRHMAGSGVPLNIMPEHVGGFTRLAGTTA
jgi:quinol monooxygenase YgiN